MWRKTRLRPDHNHLSVIVLLLNTGFALGSPQWDFYTNAYQQSASNLPPQSYGGGNFAYQRPYFGRSNGFMPFGGNFGANTGGTGGAAGQTVTTSDGQFGQVTSNGGTGEDAGSSEQTPSGTGGSAGGTSDVISGGGENAPSSGGTNPSGMVAGGPEMTNNGMMNGGTMMGTGGSGGGTMMGTGGGGGGTMMGTGGGGMMGGNVPGMMGAMRGTDGIVGGMGQQGAAEMTSNMQGMPSMPSGMGSSASNSMPMTMGSGGTGAGMTGMNGAMGGMQGMGSTNMGDMNSMPQMGSMGYGMNQMAGGMGQMQMGGGGAPGNGFGGQDMSSFGGAFGGFGGTGLFSSQDLAMTEDGGMGAMNMGNGAMGNMGNGAMGNGMCEGMGCPPQYGGMMSGGPMMGTGSMQSGSFPNPSSTMNMNNAGMGGMNNAGMGGFNGMNGGMFSGFGSGRMGAMGAPNTQPTSMLPGTGMYGGMGNPDPYGLDSGEDEEEEQAAAQAAMGGGTGPPANPGGTAVDQSNLRQYAQYLDMINKRYGIGMPGQNTGTATNGGSEATVTDVQFPASAPDTPQTSSSGLSGGAAQSGGYGSAVQGYQLQNNAYLNSARGGYYGTGLYGTQTYPVTWPMTGNGYNPMTNSVMPPTPRPLTTGSGMQMPQYPYTSMGGAGLESYGSMMGGGAGSDGYGMVPVSQTGMPGGYMTYGPDVFTGPDSMYMGGNSVTSEVVPPVQPPPAIAISAESKESRDNSSATSHQSTTSIQALTQQIRRLPAVLYVDSRSSDAKRTETMLRETYGLPLVSFYVDKIDKPKVVEKNLQQLTAHTGMPYLFICGTFIGSQEHIDNYHKNKQIPQLVEYVCGDEKDKQKKKEKKKGGSRSRRQPFLSRFRKKSTHS